MEERMEEGGSVCGGGGGVGSEGSFAQPGTSTAFTHM